MAITSYTDYDEFVNPTNGSTYRRLTGQNIWHQVNTAEKITSSDLQEYFVKKDGDTLRGDLNLGENLIGNSAEPYADTHIGTRGYNDGRYVNKTGDQMSNGLDIVSNGSGLHVKTNHENSTYNSYFQNKNGTIFATKNNGDIDLGTSSNPFWATSDAHAVSLRRYMSPAMYQWKYNHNTSSKDMADGDFRFYDHFLRIGQRPTNFQDGFDFSDIMSNRSGSSSKIAGLDTMGSIWSLDTSNSAKYKWKLERHFKINHMRTGYYEGTGKPHFEFSLDWNNLVTTGIDLVHNSNYYISVSGLF